MDSVSLHKFLTNISFIHTYMYILTKVIKLNIFSLFYKYILLHKKINK